MNRWKITIEAWPYFESDQKLAGDRVKDYHVEADDIVQALKLAETIVLGIMSNPAVWQAPITSIMQAKE